MPGVCRNGCIVDSDRCGILSAMLFVDRGGAGEEALQISGRSKEALHLSWRQ